MKESQKWLYTAAILLSMIFLAMSHQIKASQLSDVIGYYSLSASQQGMPASMSTLGSMVSMFLAIALTGRVRKQVMLVASIGAALLLLLPQYLCPTYIVFLAMNFLCGVALGVIDTLVSACMAEVHTGKRAALMMSMLHASYGVGGITAPILYGSLLEGGMAWNRLFLVLIAIGSVMLLYIFPVSMRQLKVSTATGKADGAVFTLASAKDFFSDRTLAAFTALFFCFGFSFGGMTTWMVRFVDVAYDSTMGATALSMVFTGILIGRVVTPFLPIPARKFLYIAGFGYTALFMLALLIGSDTATAILACGACILAGPIIPYAMSLGCARRLDNTLMVTTILNLSMYIGQTIAAPIMGGIESFAGIEMGMAFSHIFGLGCSIFAIIGLKERKKTA